MRGDILGGPEDDLSLSWSDQLGTCFQDYTLERLSWIGHFTPLDATD